MSYETIHKWVHKFGRFYANRVKAKSEKPSRVWHLDGIYTKMNGKMVYIWRAVDDEATVLDIVAQSLKNAKAAKRLLYKLMRNQGVMPERIVTDKLESYVSALKKRKLKHLRHVGQALSVTRLRARGFASTPEEIETPTIATSVLL